MARPIREDLRKQTRQEIKNTARRQMKEHGTAGISLRRIAREMGITAPAIYNYYASLDDLITALIVDAFTAQAEAMRSAVLRMQKEHLRTQIEAAIFAYRDWALENPIQFRLIYGNPIPGYHAPAETTIPLASQSFVVVIELYLQGWQEGTLSIPAEYTQIPQRIREFISGWKQSRGLSGPDSIFYLLAAGWSRIHGMVMLELFNHSQGVIGDPEAFYQHETRVLLDQSGFSAQQQG